MSVVPLTFAQRVEALRQFDYLPREAAFLVLSALHSGFFLRRHFCRFIGKQVGGTAASFVEKVLRNGHAQALEGCGNTQIYHLSSRPLYAALGEENNRNRRIRPAAIIKSKLMILDVVLDFPELPFLSTETEKVEFFSAIPGVQATELPAKEFRSPTARDFSVRHFVDKFPIAVCEDRYVRFCFVESGPISQRRFKVYLDQYAQLFAKMPGFEVLYAATSAAPFPVAHHTFQTFLKTHGGGESSVNVEHLLSFFKDRSAYEAGVLQGFDRSRLIRLRDDRELFSGRSFDVLFQTWQKDGDDGIRRAFALQRKSQHSMNGFLITHLLPYNYDVFGTSSRSYA